MLLEDEYSYSTMMCVYDAAMDTALGCDGDDDLIVNSSGMISMCTVLS